MKQLTGPTIKTQYAFPDAVGLRWDTPTHVVVCTIRPPIKKMEANPLPRFSIAAYKRNPLTTRDDILTPSLKKNLDLCSFLYQHGRKIMKEISQVG